MTDDIGLTAITVYLFWDTAQSNAKCLASFIPAISIAPLQSSTTQRRSRLQHGYCIGVSRRSAQATVGKGLAQGPYMAARAGVEPTTLRLKVIVSTKAPPRPTNKPVAGIIPMLMALGASVVCRYTWSH